MASRTAIELRLAEAQPRLNPRRRRLIQATLENPDQTFFLSSRALARRYSVDPATIVRTIQALGYERFADFAADLREHFKARLTPYRIIEAAAREKRSVADHIRHSVERDMGNLSALGSALDPLRVVELARRIHRSRRILVVGVDLAYALSSFLAYGLMPLGFDAEAPSGSSGNLHHKVRLLSGRDLVIAVSFGRCLRATVEAVDEAKERGVPTFGITDSDTTPIARHCDQYLIASVAGSSFTGSYVAPMSLLNAVLVACAQLKPRRSLALLRQSEKEYVAGPRWYELAPGRETASTGNGPRVEEKRRGRRVRAPRKRGE
jgi:DNA-binding MurR/RpiR family transcriptional regulator